MQGTQQLLLEITRRLVEGVSDTEIMKELNINDSELYYFYKKNIIETSKIVQSKKFQKSMAFELEMLKRHDVLFYVLYPELDPVIEKTPYAQRVDERRRVNTQGESKKALPSY